MRRFKSIEAAVAALRKRRCFAAGGVEAVWPTTGATVAERNQRGQVRRVGRSRLSLCSEPRACVCHVQGSKRELEAAEKRASRPPSKGTSHKSKGVGRGAGTQRGEKGRFEAATDANRPRDKELPTSVPMPAHVEDIIDAGMRAMWEQ